MASDVLIKIEKDKGTFYLDHLTKRGRNALTPSQMDNVNFPMKALSIIKDFLSKRKLRFKEFDV